MRLLQFSNRFCFLLIYCFFLIILICFNYLLNKWMSHNIITCKSAKFNIIDTFKYTLSHIKS